MSTSADPTTFPRVQAKGFPWPRCEICASRGSCVAGAVEGSVRREGGEGGLPAETAGAVEGYPGCYRPTRSVPVARIEAMLGRLFGDLLQQDPRLRRVVARLLDRVRSDQGAWSDLLEPSLSVQDGVAQVGRFSYGLPGFSRAPSETMELLDSLTQPFGDALADWVGRLSRILGHPAVAHPIFGLSYVGPDRWRVKLYLQFEAGPEADAAARRLAVAVLGGGETSRAARLLRGGGGGELHLLGLDLRPGGLALAKLYFLIREVDLSPASALPPPFDQVPLLGELAAAGVGRLRDVLVIHRFLGPADPRGGVPAEIDLSLLDNELVCSELFRLPSLAGSGLRREWDVLKGELRLVARRLSVCVGAVRKATLYYGLSPLGLGVGRELDVGGGGE